VRERSPHLLPPPLPAHPTARPPAPAHRTNRHTNFDPPLSHCNWSVRERSASPERPPVSLPHHTPSCATHVLLGPCAAQSCPGLLLNTLTPCVLQDKWLTSDFPLSAAAPAPAEAPPAPAAAAAAAADSACTTVRTAPASSVCVSHWQHPAITPRTGPPLAPLAPAPAALCACFACSTVLSQLLQDIPVPDILCNKRLTSINMWFSSSSSRSSLHYDPYENLLCGVAGSKRVRLYSPSAVLGLYPKPLGGEASNHSCVNFARPDLLQHPFYR
jgi:hypothetical protein